MLEIVVIGWAADIGTLTSISPNWVTMKFSIALSFVMVGLILSRSTSQKIKAYDHLRFLLTARF